MAWRGVGGEKHRGGRRVTGGKGGGDEVGRQWQGTGAGRDRGRMRLCGLVKAAGFQDLSQYACPGPATLRTGAHNAISIPDRVRWRGRPPRVTRSPLRRGQTPTSNALAVLWTPQHGPALRPRCDDGPGGPYLLCAAQHPPPPPPPARLVPWLWVISTSCQGLGLMLGTVL